MGHLFSDTKQGGMGHLFSDTKQGEMGHLFSDGGSNINSFSASIRLHAIQFFQLATCQPVTTCLYQSGMHAKQTKQRLSIARWSPCYSPVLDLRAIVCYSPVLDLRAIVCYSAALQQGLLPPMAWLPTQGREKSRVGYLWQKRLKSSKTPRKQGSHKMKLLSTMVWIQEQSQF